MFKQNPFTLAILLLFVVISACRPIPTPESPTTIPNSTPTPHVTPGDPTPTPAITISPTAITDPSPTPSEPDSPQERAPPLEPCGEPQTEILSETRVLPQEDYVADQFLLTGKANDIELILEQSQLGDSISRLLVICPFPAQEESSGSSKLAHNTVLEMQTHLFQINDGRSVWEIIQLIYTTVLGSDPIVPVFASPNYLIGEEVQSLTNGGGAVGGGGGGGAGSPSSFPPITANDFYNQWAFTDQGINLIPTPLAPQNSASVEIAIFDTAPFIKEQVLAEGGYQTINWAYPAFDLTISFPVQVVRVQPGQTDMADHGLFTTGLVHAVAPRANLHLIRVLNETGQGDVATLLHALATYQRNRWLANDHSLKNSVINLSLGTRTRTTFYGRTPNHLLDLLAELYPQLSAEEQLLLNSFINNHIAIPALNKAMIELETLGAVVVAAAGNDSAEHLPPLPMQSPAGFDNVIGVAASNDQRNRSCFSNLGDVAAPGGDAMKGRRCIPQQIAHYCTVITTMPQNCRNLFIMSLVSKDLFPNGYAYWIGTSFAAPMVSGLAGLVLEHRANLSPAEVESIIHCGATAVPAAGPLPIPGPTAPLGAGIINVQRTLTSCLP